MGHLRARAACERVIGPRVGPVSVRIAAALVLAAGLLGAGPASSAASAALVESCTVMEPHSDVELTASLDTDLPATIPLGTTRDVTTTATVTIPESVTSWVYGSLGARYVGGLAQLETDLVGPGLGSVSATVDRAPVPPTGDMTIQVTGLPQAFTAQPAGTKVVTGYLYDTALEFEDAAGDPVASTLLIVCSPKVTTPAQDLTIDTVSIGAPRQATTTDVAARYRGRAKVATVRIAVTNVDRSAASGDVGLVLRRGRARVGHATVSLGPAGTAHVAFHGVARRGHYVVVATFDGSPTSKRSRGSAIFTVR